MAENYKKWGCCLEFITDRSQEGTQFCRGFGGIGGTLRWKVLVVGFRTEHRCACQLRCTPPPLSQPRTGSCVFCSTAKNAARTLRAQQVDFGAIERAEELDAELEGVDDEYGF